VKPYLRNDFKFKPHFSGRFVEVDGQIVLEGRFGPRKDWIFPLAGLGMLLGGAGMVKLGSWWSRDDVAWLAGLIRDALTAP